jgi:hypothetical protein
MVVVAEFCIFLHETLVAEGFETYEHGMLTEPPPVPLNVEVLSEMVTSGLSIKIFIHT